MTTKRSNKRKRDKEISIQPKKKFRSENNYKKTSKDLIDSFFKILENGEKNFDIQDGIGYIPNTYIRIPMMKPLNIMSMKEYGGNNTYKLYWIHLDLLSKVNENDNLKKGFLRISGMPLFITENQCYKLFKISHDDIKEYLKDIKNILIKNMYFQRYEDGTEYLYSHGVTKVYHLAEIVEHMEKSHPESFQHLQGGKSELLDKNLEKIIEIQKNKQLPKWLRRANRILREDEISKQEYRMHCNTEEDKALINMNKRVPSLKSLCLNVIHQSGNIGELNAKKFVDFNGNSILPQEIMDSIWPQATVDEGLIKDIESIFTLNALSKVEFYNIMENMNKIRIQYDNMNEYLNAILSELIKETISKSLFIENEYMSERKIRKYDSLKNQSKIEKMDIILKNKKEDRKILLILYIKLRISQRIGLPLIIKAQNEKEVIRGYFESSEKNKIKTNRNLADLLLRAAGLKKDENDIFIKDSFLGF